jgi:hypothetical protein
MLETQTELEGRFSLFHFVSRSCSQGLEWVRDCPWTDYGELAQRIDQSMVSLRGRQLSAGFTLLEQVDGRLALLRGISAVLCRMLERSYHGTVAYYHYCVDNFDAAEDALLRAQDAVVASIDLQPLLVPFAAHCTDLRLQRARIARNRERWYEMRQHVETARAMMEDQTPFCVLMDGTPIKLSTIKRFYQNISLSDEERGALSYILDDEVRLERFEYSAERIYALPGIAIPYR